MNVYTDPKIFDMAGAVEKLPAMKAFEAPDSAAANSLRTSLGRSKSVSTAPAGIGYCSAVSGSQKRPAGRSLTPLSGGDWQQKTPSGKDGVNEAGEGGRTLDIHVGNVTLYH